MVNEMKLLKDFENWYNDNKNEFDDDYDDIDIIEKYTITQFDSEVERDFYFTDREIYIDLTHNQYHTCIDFIMNKFGMTFNELDPNNVLNYYMKYMVLCDDWFCRKFHNITDIISSDDDM
jgi:hypothetical protein